MQPGEQGKTEVLVEQDNHTWKALGHVVDFELSFNEPDDYFIDVPYRTPRKTLTITLDIQDVTLLGTKPLAQALAAQLAAQLYEAMPQRYVLGADAPPATVEELTPTVEEVESDYPSDWKYMGDV